MSKKKLKQHLRLKLSPQPIPVMGNASA